MLWLAAGVDAKSRQITIISWLIIISDKKKDEIVDKVIVEFGGWWKTQHIEQDRTELFWKSAVLN